MKSLLLALLCTVPCLRAGENVFRVVCFGDSLTGERPGKPYLHQYLKWTDLVQMGLELRLGTGRAEVLNRGYAGDATYKRGDRPGAVNRVEADLLAARPDIAVILIGGNNFAEKTRPPEELQAQLKTDLTEIVAKVQAAGIRVLLLQYPEPRAADMAKVWVHLDDGNPVIAEVAKAQGTALLDLGPAFAEAAKTRPLNELLHPVDGVHLQPYGEILVAREVMMELERLQWLEAPPP